MKSKRTLFHGMIEFEDSLLKTNIYFLGIRILKICYFAEKKEYRLFGIFRILTRAGYPYKVSVLMQAHNAEQRIAGAIASVLAQTFSDFEFIIINNGGADNTANIVRGYKDPRIMFVDNERTIDPAGVLKMGIGLCRGEYIAWMDANALPHPNRLARQVAFMDRHPGVGVLGRRFRSAGHPPAMLRKSMLG